MYLTKAVKPSRLLNIFISVAKSEDLHTVVSLTSSDLGGYFNAHFTLDCFEYFKKLTFT